MKRFILSIMALMASTILHAQEFDTTFSDATLRLDYTFAGNAQEQFVALGDMSKTPGWWGRRINLDTVPMKGNGDLTLTDAKTNRVIYKTSFSSLFQEWITTPEATTITRSFEFTLLVPMPRAAAVATLVLRDNTGKESKHCFTINPTDVLIRNRADVEPLPHTYIHRGGDSKECIDVVILAEGYTAEEMATFMEDAKTTANEILSYEPFKSHSDKFNFIAVASPSEDSNVSVPQQDAWRSTAVGSNFMTFYMARYLTSSHVYAMYDLVTNLSNGFTETSFPTI